MNPTSTNSTYRLQLKFKNSQDDNIKASMSVSNADSNVTKSTVETFSAVRSNIYTDTTVLYAANLIQTTTTDLLID